MKILHVIGSVDLREGGPAFMVRQMSQGLLLEGQKVSVCSSYKKIEELGGFADGVQLYCFLRWFNAYKLSWGGFWFLWREVQKFDVVHVHGVLSFLPASACLWCRFFGVRYVVRPLGIMNQYGMTGWKGKLKKAWLRWVEGWGVEGADVIHFTSEMEEVEARALGLRMKAAVVELGIDLKDYLSLAKNYSLDEGRRLRVLFMSRIDPKKGIEHLLEAVGESDLRERVELVVAGSGDEEGYFNKLKKAGEEKKINVKWLGYVEGEKKLYWMQWAEVFVLPSYSDNFGVALLEGMAAGCACVAGNGVALAVKNQDVIEVITAEKDLKMILKNLIENREMIAGLGQKCRERAEERYEIKVMTKKLLEIYEVR
jgi:glycosyltransferase involved in cell wall biosynthesis